MIAYYKDLGVQFEIDDVYVFDDRALSVAAHAGSSERCVMAPRTRRSTPGMARRGSRLRWEGGFIMLRSRF